MEITTTYIENKKIVTHHSVARFSPDDDTQELSIINIYPSVEFQAIKGFGGAFTEAAGYVLSKMGKEKRQEILQDVYGENGLKYTCGRVPVDSCDFALGNYSAVTDETDTDFSTFSLARDEAYIIPIIEEAEAITGQKISLLQSPWSPPAFMKSNGQKNGGGYLKPEYRAQWAKYLCRYIKEYRARGLNVFALSIQNEPNAKQKWDSCQYTPEEEQFFIRDYLVPALHKSGLDDVILTIWDHNKERAFDRTAYICSDEKVDQAVGAVGLHWYSGDHFDALRLITKEFPDKLLIFTEGCVEYSRFEKDNQLKNAEIYAHDLIGNLNEGLHMFFDWNLCLDQSGGPNHVGNLCDAPIMCDIEKGTYDKKLSYYYIGHFTRFINIGAKRIGLTRFSHELEVTAFKNPDGSIVTIILNVTDKDIDFYLRGPEGICALEAKAHSIQTIEL